MLRLILLALSYIAFSAAVDAECPEEDTPLVFRVLDDASNFDDLCNDDAKATKCTNADKGEACVGDGKCGTDAEVAEDDKACGENKEPLYLKCQATCSDDEDDGESDVGADGDPNNDNEKNDNEGGANGAGNGVDDSVNDDTVNEVEKYRCPTDATGVQKDLKDHQEKTCEACAKLGDECKKCADAEENQPCKGEDTDAEETKTCVGGNLVGKVVHFKCPAAVVNKDATPRTATVSLVGILAASFVAK